MIRAEHEPDDAIASYDCPPAERRAEAKERLRGRSRSAAAKNARRVALTNYTLRLPGKDKRFGTADDLFVRDGMIVAPPADEAPAPRAADAPREVKLP